MTRFEVLRQPPVCYSGHACCEQRLQAAHACPAFILLFRKRDDPQMRTPAGAAKAKVSSSLWHSAAAASRRRQR